MKDENKIVVLIAVNFLLDIVSLIGGIMLIVTGMFKVGYPLTGCILAMMFSALYFVRSVLRGEFPKIPKIKQDETHGH